MGFVNSLRDVWRSFSGEEDDEYTPDDVYATANPGSTAPDYAAYAAAQQPPVTQAPSHPTAVPDAVVSKIVLLRPEKLSSVREAADHFLKDEAVVLSLTRTEPTLARRWLDYLGGVSYAMDGKINRIAPYTYLLTPRGVQLVAGFETEEAPGEQIQGQ